MSNFRKIIAALGISEYSRGIFNYAARLATAIDADLTVVHVINSRDVDTVRRISAMGYNVDGEHYLQNVREDRMRFLEDIFSQSAFPRERLHILIQVGNPIEELLKLTLEEDADMIVMGPKGSTDLTHVLVGSVASKLFRHSPITVVSYREEKLASRLRDRIHKDL
jgi:nucleotide-binding universal stress UspA family protein